MTMLAHRGVRIDAAAGHAREPRFLGVPVPDGLRPAADYLVARGYNACRLRAAVEHMTFRGTAQCCEAIDDRDRDAVENLIPASRAWHRPLWDGLTIDAVDPPDDDRGRPAHAPPRP